MLPDVLAMQKQNRLNTQAMPQRTFDKAENVEDECQNPSSPSGAAANVQNNARESPKGKDLGHAREEMWGIGYQGATFGQNDGAAKPVVPTPIRKASRNRPHIKAHCSQDTILSTSKRRKSSGTHKAISSYQSEMLSRIALPERKRVQTYIKESEQISPRDPLRKYLNYNTYRQLKSGQGQRGGSIPNDYNLFDYTSFAANWTEATAQFPIEKSEANVKNSIFS